MRDPKRIKKILKVLERIWSQYPNLRLGQLLENALNRSEVSVQNGHCMFYVEDGDLVLALCEFVGRENRPEKTTRISGTLKALRMLREIELRIKSDKKRSRKRKKFAGSEYKFPECLMPGGGETGHGDTKVAKRRKRKQRR